MSNRSPDVHDKYEPPTASQLAAATRFVARFAERWDRPDADAMRDLMHPDTQNLIPPMTSPADREGVVAHFRSVLQRLPDLRLDVVRWAPTGDTVMIEWAAMASIGGRPLRWTGIDRFRLRDDRMYEARVYWDTRGLDEQIAQAVQATQSTTAASSAALQ